MNIGRTDKRDVKGTDRDFQQVLAVAALIVALTALRVIYASLIDLRTDEAYYWTWSKENVLLPRPSADDCLVHPLRHCDLRRYQFGRTV